MTECPTTQPEIADVQSSKDTRHIAINKVGIKDIRHPVRIKDRSGGEQHTVANFNMYVNLPHNFKGTHMSRFVEILNSHDREIGVESFNDILRDMAERLEAEAGHIEMNFPYFINKHFIKAELKRRNIMMYFHPWEFDSEQPRQKLGILKKTRHYIGLNRNRKKFENLLDDFSFQTLNEMALVSRSEPWN